MGMLASRSQLDPTRAALDVGDRHRRAVSQAWAGGSQQEGGLVLFLCFRQVMSHVVLVRDDAPRGFGVARVC